MKKQPRKPWAHWRTVRRINAAQKSAATWCADARLVYEIAYKVDEAMRARIFDLAAERQRDAARISANARRSYEYTDVG